MTRYDCKGYIKITIHEDLIFADIEMQHLLHQLRPDISVSLEIKQFILDNIDLLPRDIYKRLIEQGLNINICQKQIHFWWTQLGKSRYKWDEDSFLSATKWLK